MSTEFLSGPPAFCGALLQFEQVLEEATTRCGSLSSMGSSPFDEDEDDEVVLNDNNGDDRHGALRDRGQKIKGLKARTTQMSESAMDYRSMAAQLKEKTMSKKWYQL